MALSGSLVNQFSTGYRVLIEWTATQNISANTSTITARFYLQSMGSGYPIYSSAKKTVRITIDGTTYTSAENTAQLAGGQKKLMATATKTVQHNADGTKSITISGSIDLNATLSGTYYGTVNIAQQSFTLNTIPRASSVSLSASNVQFGKSVTISISRASSSFTHRLRYSVAGQSGTIATGVGTSYRWTVPTSLINGLTNTKSAKCTIYCDTYSGSTLIGTKSVTLTVNIPVSTAQLSASSVNYGQSVNITISRAHSKLKHRLRYNWNGNSGNITSSATVDTSYSWTVPLNFMNYIPNATSTTGTIYVDTYNGSALVGTVSLSLKTNVPSSVVPTFNTVTHSEANSTVAALNLGSGTYAQNLSRLNLAITGAQGAYGSTIKSYKITVDGKTYNSQSATSSTITGSGTLTITGTITDSRGRTATKSVSINVLKYSIPTITNFKVYRSDANGNRMDLGTYIKVEYAGTNIYSLNSKNTITLYIDTKPRTSSTWQTKYTLSITQNFSGSRVLGSTSDPYDITQSYDVRLRIVDKFYTVKSELSVSTGIVTLSLGKTGIGIGKVLENGFLDVAGDGYFAGNIFLGQNKRINNAPRLFDLTGQVQTQSYVKSVIALCEVTNDNPNLNSFSVGTLIFHRTNGLHVDGKIEIAMSKKYNESRPNVSILSMALNEKVYPCTFMYNGKKYGGVMVEMATAQFQQVYFFGEGNFDVFGVDYYRSSTDEILNQEVYNSINLNDVFWNQNAILYQGLPIVAIDPELIIVTRDGTTAGTQTVSTTKGRMPKVIIGVASGQSPALAYSSWGYWDNVRQRCVYYDGSSFSPVTHFLQVGTSSNRLYCTISSVSSSNITLSWTKSGNGVNTTVTLYLLVFYQ